MKILIVIFVVLSILSSFSLIFAQENTWYQTYNLYTSPNLSSNTYYFHNIWQEPEDNFMVAGSFYCEISWQGLISPDYRGFVMEIDSNGVLINHTTKPWYDIEIVKIPGTGYAYILKLEPTRNLYILDESFNLIESFQSDSLAYHSIDFVEEDSSLILSGKKYNGDFFLQKLDIDGNQQWLSFYNLPFFFHTDVSDNGISAIGSSSTTWWADDLIMIHIDSEGLLQWTQEFDCFGSEDISFRKVSFISTSDNGYLVGGQIDYSGTIYHNGFALKLCPDGSIEWLNIYDSNYPINAFTEKDDGYILWDTEGCSILAIDLNGELLWSHSFEYSNYTNMHNILELTNGYLINGDLNGDYCYFAKINEQGLVPVNNNTILQKKIILSNYPNPFNPSTTIEFSLQNHAEIEVTIFNTKGETIKQLISSHMSAGKQSIHWNGDDEAGKSVSSGIYYYQLNVNGKTEAVKKCLLLK